MERKICEACGRMFATQSGLSQHEKHGYPEARNAARASGSARSQPASRRTIFSEEEENLMLELKVQFRGERFMAQRMTEFLLANTNKQIRDKRASASYRNRLRKVLRQEDARHGAADKAEVQDEDDDVFEETNVLPAFPAEEQRHQSRYNLRRNKSYRMERREPESDAPEVVGALPTPPEVTARRSEGEQPHTERKLHDDNEAANSPREISWREKVARQVLQVESPNAIPSEAAACVQLLKEILTEIANRNLPNREHMEETDRKIEELFHRYEPGRKHGRLGHSKKSKSSRAVYKYARTQQLYRLNPGLLVKHARKGTNWTEEPRPDLSSEDIKSKYNSLWGTKPPIDPPAFGIAEMRVALDEVLTHITFSEAD